MAVPYMQGSYPNAGNQYNPYGAAQFYQNTTSPMGWGGSFSYNAVQSPYAYGLNPNSMYGYMSSIYRDNTNANINYLDNYVRSLAGNQNYDLGLKNVDLSRYGIDTNNATQRYGIDQNNQTARYGWDTQRGINDTTQTAETGRNRYGWDAQQNIANTNIKPQMESLAFQKERFGQVFPWIQQMFGGMNGGFDVGAQPNVNAQDYVYSPQVMAQNMNNIAGQGAKWTAGQQRNIGMNSNISQAAKSGLGQRAAAMGHSQVGDKQLAFQNQAATANAGQSLAANNLRQNAWNNKAQVGLGKYQAQTGRMTPFLNMLG